MTRAAYDSLQRELAAIEARSGLYLADENVDRENVDTPEEDAAFWAHMLSAAQMAAGQRAENEGQSINDLIGRVIY